MIDPCILDSLGCADQPNLGGSYHTLWVLRWQDVEEVPHVCDGSETSLPITIKPGTASVSYKFLPDTLRYRERPKKSPHGTYIEYVVEGFRPKMSPAHEHEICKLMKGYYILIYEDANGYVRLLGDKTHPMIFTPSGDTGKSGKDTNGIDWQFKGIGLCPSIFMDPSIPPPNESVIPLAKLTATGPDALCIYQLTALGSKTTDDVLITAATPAATAVLQYSFFKGSENIYNVEIAPDADATLIGSWTILPFGTRSSAQFEAEVVDYIQAGGTGFAFDLSMDGLTAAFGVGVLIRVRMAVKQGTKNSLAVEVELQTCEIELEEFTFQTDLNPATDDNFDPAIIQPSTGTWVFENSEEFESNSINIDGVTEGLNGTTQDVVLKVLALSQITSLIMDNDKIVGSVDLSSFSALTTLNLNDNLGLNQVTIGTGSIITNPGIARCGITGTLNFSQRQIAGSVDFSENPNMTGITFHGLTTNMLGQLYVWGNGLTTLDLSNVLINLWLYAYDNPGLQSVTIAPGTTLQKCYFYECDLDPVLDLSNVTLTGSSTGFAQRDNPRLESIIHSASTAKFWFYQVERCNINYYDLTMLSTMFDRNSGLFYFHDNNMSVEHVNHFLVDFDSMSDNAYSGRVIDIGGSNAAPNDGSGAGGGYDGLTAKANLIAKGFTVTTS